MATAVYGGSQSYTTTTTLAADRTLQTPSQADDQQYITTFFCRALYDYQSGDDSSLSFHRDDIIEVLTRLETGWWDGLLGEERGWFPSNYVAILSEAEADAIFSAAEFQRPQQSSATVETPLSQSSSTLHSMSSSSSISRSLSRNDGNWLDGEPEYVPGRNGLDELASTSMDHVAQSNDFWVPQVTSDGQIYYVNTQTGQHSRDLPMEAEDDLSDADFRVSAQQRPGSGPSPGYRRASGRQSNGGTAGFGLPKRSGTPEPWVRRLADDGMSYFYVNKLDGTVRWTLPEGHSTPRVNGDRESASRQGSTQADQFRRREVESMRSRSNSSASYLRRGRDDSGTGFSTLYDDDSDVDPLERATAKRYQTPNGSRALNSRPSQSQNHTLPSHEQTQQLTSAEKLAQALQNSLAPPPSESLTTVSGTARQAVAAIINFIQTHGVSGQLEDQRELESRILDTVVAIRHLLCVSSPPYGQIPSSLYPNDGPPPGDSAYTQSLQAQLKPSQRRVTATLSKLVLAAVAAQYDANSFSSDAPTRMEADASELDRALVTFVLEVQRSSNQSGIPSQRKPTVKRLFAVLSPSNIGLGLIGAGSAGGWKGFGWVASPGTEELPQRVLGADVLAELRAKAVRFDERLTALQSSVAGDVGAVDLVRIIGREVVAWLHTLLTFIADVNIARTVDIDGISREGQAPNGDVYMQSVQKARALVRTLEAVVQSLYDDGTSLFLVIQSYPQYWSSEIGSYIDQLQSLVGALQVNTAQVLPTFEALLLIGQDQAAKGPSDYRGSIEWRMSRIINIDRSLGQALSDMSAFEEDYDEGEDVVDMRVMERVLRKPSVLKPSSSMDRSQGSSTFYSQPSQTSESSLDARSRSRAASNAAAPWSQHKASDSMLSLTPPPSHASDDHASVFPDDDEAVLPPAVISSKSPSRADKLIRMLGDAPTHIIDKLNADSKPWYLRPNYSDAEIQIDPDGKVRAGTVPALVERLTAHEHSDTSFSKTFLLTYKSFTDLDTLYDLLVQRFWIKPPDTLKPNELEEWTKLKQHIIRMRVLNTFKTMIQDEDTLEKEDLYILDQMKEMVSGPEVVNLAAAKQLVVLIERAQKGDNARAKTTMSLDPQPPSIIPKASKKNKLLEFDPTEVARQLTTIECQLYMKIKPSECLMRTEKQKAGDVNDNIGAIIETTNKIAHWVADTVLSKEDSRKRALIVKQFISVADRCRDIHNFSSMIAIVSGLNSPPIRRLKRTWEQINQKFMTMLGTCEMTIDSNKNFSNYRSLLQRITPPCVPFFGLYLTTLTFIQDGAPNMVSGNLVNFRKRQKAAEVIEEIQKWQSKPFNFAKVDVIYDYIQDCLTKFNDVPDVSDLFWNLSLEREPREREDEKMARLLQETGFL
ncbi:ras GEF [Artomyces pyxidatus]|uniref:Ras GEF n=1 Tax=Artomyces pyxidatus TaxID=48021 RepID=A0ACB8SZN0_9AGAM|nr:ras GEF [Artomyces pyxidatus]